jgi:hypothetical protein
MADDQQNPFTMMGMMKMMQPNPYTQYKGLLPIPGYRGAPTDASGNPIQSFTDAQAAHDAWQPPAQGTTLNTNPAAAPSPQLSGLSGAWPINPSGAANQSWLNSAQNPAMQARMNPGPGAYYAQGPSGFSSNQYENGRVPMTPFAQAPVGPSQQPAAAAAASTPSNPIDMRQAYLDALANPGKVTTQGATVPQAAPLGQPSVLNSFLATHAPGPAAPAGGGYSNAGFFDTLNKLRSA